MADPIQGPKRGIPQENAHSRAQEASAAEKAQKATEVQASQQPSISYLKDGGPPMGKGPKDAFDPYNPILPPPTILLTSEETNKIQKDLSDKFKEPITIETLEERVHDITNLAAKKIIEHERVAKVKIEEICTSDRSIEYKQMQIQQILMDTMQRSLEIGGEYSKFIQKKQEEAQTEAGKQRGIQIEAQKKSAVVQLITKIFAAIGEFFNMIAAGCAVFAAFAATAATGPAGALAAFGASVWFAAALAGFSARFNEALPENMRGFTPLTGEAAIAFTSLQMIGSIGGMVLTAGATSYLSGAQAVMQSCEAVNTTANTILQAQQAGAAISNSLLTAAQNAKIATDALLTAIKAGGTLSKNLTDTALNSAKILRGVIETTSKAGGTLPLGVTTQSITKASLDVMAKSAEGLITAGTTQIEDIAIMTTRVTTILQYSAYGANVLSAASTGIVLPIASAVFKKEIADAEAKKTEQEAEIDQTRYTINNNTTMIQNVLKSFTDLSKDLSSYMKESSKLAQNVLKNV